MGGITLLPGEPMKAFGFAMTLALAVVFAHPSEAAPPRPASGGFSVGTANTMIDILSASVVLTATPTDYVNDYVEAAGTFGLQVRVKSSSNTGMSVVVRCADPSPQIRLTDLLIRTQTPAGAGGTTMSSYLPITANDQLLWSTHADQSQWQVIYTDLKIRNIGGYDTSGPSGTMNYTNTLTYTVITL
jgi:hypothetical protein